MSPPSVPTGTSCEAHSQAQELPQSCGTRQGKAAARASTPVACRFASAYGLDTEHVEELLTLLKSPEWSITAEVFLEQLPQPTLAIFGERNAVVDWRDSIDVYRTSFARSGNRDLTITTFPKADHEMLSATQGSAPSTYVTGYIDTMTKWLAARNFSSQTDN